MACHPTCPPKRSEGGSFVIHYQPCFAEAAQGILPFPIRFTHRKA